MGEIAEMMLDGTLCECCGEFIGHDTGIPGYCSRQCAKDRGALIDIIEADHTKGGPRPSKITCLRETRQKSWSRRSC